MLSSNAKDENDFANKLLLTNTQVSKLRKALANDSSATVQLSKTQLHKIGQSGEILGRLFGPLFWTIIKNWIALNKK